MVPVSRHPQAGVASSPVAMCERGEPARSLRLLHVGGHSVLKPNLDSRCVYFGYMMLFGD